MLIRKNLWSVLVVKGDPELSQALHQESGDGVLLARVAECPSRRLAL